MNKADDGTHHSFCEFVDDENKLKEVLATNGIGYGRSHRFAKAYSIFREKNDDITKNGVTNFSGNDIMLLIDLCEMNSIIKWLHEVPRDVLNEKWDRLIRGSSERWKDSHSSSVGRNIQFEMVLFSDFRSSGINCSLMNNTEDNPDILINHEGKHLNIQCKRILGNNENAVQRNIYKASHQLRINHKKNNNLGAIALSIERIYSKGNSFVSSCDRQNALSFIKMTHDDFNKKYRRFWCSKKVLQTENIPIIILYTSQVAKLSNDSLKYSHVTERDFLETINSVKNREKFLKLENIFKKPTDSG